MAAGEIKTSAGPFCVLPMKQFGCWKSKEENEVPLQCPRGQGQPDVHLAQGLYYTRLPRRHLGAHYLSVTLCDRHHLRAYCVPKDFLSIYKY